MNYVKVINNEIKEINKGVGDQTKLTIENNWLPLMQEKPNHDPQTQFLVHSHFEIKDNTVVEHFKTVDINFETNEDNDTDIEDNDLEE